MQDAMIDGLLAALLISVGYIVYSLVKRYVSKGFVSSRKWLLKKKYPINTDSLPLEALKFGDNVIINNIPCVYYGKKDGKHYIEALLGAPFSGVSYLYTDEAYLKANATKLYNSTVIKWEK